MYRPSLSALLLLVLAGAPGRGQNLRYVLDVGPPGDASTVADGATEMVVNEDGGGPVQVRDDDTGITARLEGYAARRRYIESHGMDPSRVDPLVGDYAMVTRSTGTMVLTLTGIPQGRYGLTMYFNDVWAHCGSCNPVTVAAGGETERQFVYTTGVYRPEDAGKFTHNFTVGSDGRMMARMVNDGGSTSRCGGGCAASDVNQCTRCSGAHMHLTFAGLVLVGFNSATPTAAPTPLTTSTTTTTTHTVFRSIDREMSSLWDAVNQRPSANDFRAMRDEMRTRIAALNTTLGALVSQVTTIEGTVDRLALDMDQTREAISRAVAAIAASVPITMRGAATPTQCRGQQQQCQQPRIVATGSDVTVTAARGAITLASAACGDVTVCDIRASVAGIADAITELTLE